MKQINLRASKLGWGHRFKRKMGLHGEEIAIIVEKDQILNDTKSCDNYINCFPDGNASFPKGAIILGTLNSDIVSPNLAKRESA